MTVGLVLAVVAACTDEDKRELGEVDVRDSLSMRIDGALVAEGLAIEGDLDCSATITADGTVSSTCSGTATSGVGVNGAYRGAADIDAERCTADLTISVDDTVVASDPGVDCFAVE
jgi:hypothetical protein